MKIRVTALASALVLGLASAWMPVHAAPVKFDFTVLGTPGSGSFGFESSAGSINGFGETEYTLTSFSFTLGAATYGLAALEGDLGWAIFSGGLLRGLEAVGDGAAFSFLPGTSMTAPFLIVSGIAGQTPTRTYGLEFTTSRSDVPEPGSAALSLAALALASLALRRRRRDAP